MIQLVEEYDKYVSNLPELVSKSYYKAEYFIQNLGLKNATYYRKLKENNFTAQEIKKITELLFPEEVTRRVWCFDFLDEFTWKNWSKGRLF